MALWDSLPDAAGRGFPGLFDIPAKMVALVLLEWRVLVLKVGVDCPQTLHEPGSSAAYSAQLDQAKALHQNAPPLRSDLGDQEICCSKKNATFPWPN